MTLKDLQTVTTTDATTFYYDNNTFNKSVNLSEYVEDSVKQMAKNKLISQLDPIQWYKLEDDTMVMVCIKQENDSTKTCRTSLGDMKRYLLGEILDELKRREGITPSPH